MTKNLLNPPHLDHNRPISNQLKTIATYLLSITTLSLTTNYYTMGCNCNTSGSCSCATSGNCGCETNCGCDNCPQKK
ncbi:hypothetical protein F4821DRAFT_222183 [Hypoxylon rubiginosum]|uniref:Uncharacterized protein n=1 Tax=Hypoxylon rubiginosum TaxID=110542 RepID=A0ACC0DJY6_9PEZI|nr:hypothetical protein F4821DRAFT_222183 [Hypoxylon rubiginosum]